MQAREAGSATQLFDFAQRQNAANWDDSRPPSNLTTTGLPEAQMTDQARQHRDRPWRMARLNVIGF